MFWCLWLYFVDLYRRLQQIQCIRRWRTTITRWWTRPSYWRSWQNSYKRSVSITPPHPGRLETKMTRHIPGKVASLMTCLSAVNRVLVSMIADSEYHGAEPILLTNNTIPLTTIYCGAEPILLTNNTIPISLQYIVEHSPYFLPTIQCLSHYNKLWSPANTSY